jgi:hypothetical protein
MEQLDLNSLLDRNQLAEKIKNLLLHFNKNKQDLTLKRGIYIYGPPGSGKTTFIQNLLKKLNYDIVKYDAGDIRNKSIIDTITKHNMSDKNILSLFNQESKYIAIIMDEIDGMNNGDKGGINSLIKIIRPKKTKKQKLEELSLNPIICISNNHIDKKIKELMKVCYSFELKIPTLNQLNKMINITMPKLNNDNIFKNNVISFIQGDLRKFFYICNIYKNDNNILSNEIMQDIFKAKSLNDDSKEITKNLLNNKYHIDQHNILMNETDRTIVGLLWHENVIDIFYKLPKKQSIQIYDKLLANICFADYIDRITFQKQIWQFNEMSSLLKTLYNNKILHENIENATKFSIDDIRFTKILTKYSTEYNNNIFIQNLCQELGFDKKDLFAFFTKLKVTFSDTEIYNLFETYEINKLDINRIYRYLDKYSNQIDKIDEHIEIDYIENINIDNL